MSTNVVVQPARALLPNWQETPPECCGIWTGDGRYFLVRSSTTVENANMG
jgi:hypothetical protein